MTPLSQQALRAGSARKDGAAAHLAEIGKKRTYKSIPVNPMVIEFGGRLGGTLLRVVRSIVPHGTPDRSEVLGAAWQSISATVQRTMAWQINSANL